MTRPNSYLRARIGTACVLIYEQLVPVLWPLILCGLVWIQLVVWGAVERISAAAFAWLSIGLLGCTLIATLSRGRRCIWPTRSSINRRLETTHDLHHRPLTAVHDTAAAGDSMLWQTHQQGQGQKLADLRIPRPHAVWVKADRFALRWGLVLLLGLGLWAEGANLPARWGLARTALTPDVTEIATIEAVITPPSYTRMPPVYLPESGRIRVPVGSQLTVRIPNDRTGYRLMGAGLHRTGNTEDSQVLQGKITNTGVITLGRMSTLRRWAIHAIADTPPQVRWAGKPSRGRKDHLRLPVRISDDYGVSRAQIQIDDRIGRHAKIPVTLTAKDAKGIVWLDADLATSPWAGQRVRLSVVAEDAIGQKGTSPTAWIDIPERRYTAPLAQSLSELRGWLDHRTRKIITPPQLKPLPVGWFGDEPVRVPELELRMVQHHPALKDVAVALDALTTQMRDFTADPLMIMGLRTALGQAALARNAKDIKAVQALLGQLAERAEFGTAKDAREAFEAASKALSDAIARHAPEDEITLLHEDLQQAFARLMQSLAEEADAPDQASAPPSGGHMDMGELLDLMREIDERAQNGDTAGAQQLLAVLTDIMAQLKLSGAPQGSSANNPYGPLLDQQRALADETRRWMRTMDDTAPNLGDMAKTQELLAEKTGQLADGKAAAEQMQAAADLLRLGEVDAALDAQRAAGRALIAASERARTAAERNRDPLAKALGEKDALGRRISNGAGVNVDAADGPNRMRRMKQAIEERLRDQDLSPEARAYLERLLKTF